MSDVTEFDFNAPKYHDFNSAVDDKEVDSFFDTDHEVPQSASKNEKYHIPNLNLKQEIITPDVKHNMEPVIDNIKSEDNRNFNQSSTPRFFRKAHRRNSSISPTSTIRSNNTEDMLNQAMECISVKPEKKRRTLFEGISLSVHTENEKQHRMTTRHDQISKTPMLDLRSRSVVRDNKRKNLSDIKKSEAKYVRMEDRSNHFERDFHLRRLSDNYKKNQNLKSRRTIPHTPNLIAVHRNRPITALSLQMKEQLEVEEMKNHQIKALPLNKEIFKEPSFPLKPESKPVTKPYPFKLTAKVMKKPVAEEKPFHFTARPIPKTVFETPVLRPLREKVVRVPALDDKDTSYFIKQKEIALQGIKAIANSKRFTEPQPFSFEERTKQMLKKKEDKIKEYLDEEKKAREFHANPLPVFVTSKAKENSTILPTVPATPKLKIQERIQQRHQRDNNKSMEEVCKPFKARSSSVLHKKPFEPKKPERPLLDVIEIELNTERRAREREVFDLTIKEREQKLECFKREREMELKRREEEEIARLRKDITHKAIPVPSFKPMVIKKSEKPLTDPHSPFFTHRSKTSSQDNNI